MSRLYGNQAGPTKRDAASTDPRSRSDDHARNFPYECNDPGWLT